MATEGDNGRSASAVPNSKHGISFLLNPSVEDVESEAKKRRKKSQMEEESQNQEWVDKIVHMWTTELRRMVYCSFFSPTCMAPSEDGTFLCPLRGCHSRLQSRGNLRRHVESHLLKMEANCRKRLLKKLQTNPYLFAGISKCPRNELTDQFAAFTIKRWDPQLPSGR